MSATFFLNPASRAAIAGRIAEWQQQFRSLSQFTVLSDHQFADSPLTRVEVRAEIAKWYWQL